MKFSLEKKSVPDKLIAIPLHRLSQKFNLFLKRLQLMPKHIRTDSNQSYNIYHRGNQIFCALVFFR
jgi:hypothetical protein